MHFRILQNRLQNSYYKYKNMLLFIFKKSFIVSRLVIQLNSSSSLSFVSIRSHPIIEIVVLSSGSLSPILSFPLWLAVAEMSVNQRELDESIRVNLILVGISARRRSPHTLTRCTSIGAQMGLRQSISGKRDCIGLSNACSVRSAMVMPTRLALPYSIGLVVEIVSKSLPNLPLLSLYIYTNYVYVVVKGGNHKI